MNFVCKVNTELDVPIYQQISDAVCAAVKSGVISSGEQLPTVQEMTDELGIARGTVKRAYDELERIGLIEKVQGRGTFVKYQPANSGSRKEQAVAAIDEMLDRLENMGFTAQEINIFLNLKLRERSQEESSVKIAVIECNPENLSQMSEQLRHIEGVDIYSYTLDSIEQYPYKLSEEFDLIVTTSLHAQYLEGIIPVNKRIARVALRPSARCLAAVIKLPRGAKTGIVGYSGRFAELIYDTCVMYADDIVPGKPFAISEDDDLEGYLADKEFILVPRNYEKYFDAASVNAILNFRGNVINYNYEMDEGSVLYLETKVRKIIDEKTII